jgi:hypothetical protein
MINLASLVEVYMSLFIKFGNILFIMMAILIIDCSSIDRD